MNFQNKNIVITGASSGIGYEMAKELAKEGANLALLARRKNILDELAAEFKSLKSKIITYECDVTSYQSTKASFDSIKKELGYVDIAILNAGASYRMKVENFDADKIEEIFNVNVIGMVNCINELIPDFIKRRNGIIAGVSSLSDVRGFPGSAAYCSSKAAASTFLESIRIELKKYNVKVITIKPGFVKTPMTDKNEFQMPFLIEAEKASQIILNGLRKEKKIISFPFPTVLGSRVLKLLPDFIYDYLMTLPLPSKK